MFNAKPVTYVTFITINQLVQILKPIFIVTKETITSATLIASIRKQRAQNVIRKHYGNIILNVVTFNC